MDKKTTKRRSAADQDKIVVEALRGVGRPVSAYELIEELRDKGVTAPPTVYRALNRLIEDGLAHRLESLNAFVCCADAGCHRRTEGVAAFAICSKCGRVDEFTDAEVGDRLAGWAAAEGFGLERTTIELRGVCKGCREAR